MLLVIPFYSAKTLEHRTSWNTEHSADTKLLQPCEEVVTDFDGHVDVDFRFFFWTDGLVC